MARDNPFFDDWKACLRAHYEHVITTDDRVTEPTLRYVLHATGFEFAEIDAMRAGALLAIGIVEEPPPPDPIVEAVAVVAEAPFLEIVPDAVPEPAPEPIDWLQPSETAMPPKPKKAAQLSLF